MQIRIGSGLNPPACLLRIEIRNPQRALERPRRRIGLHVGHECHERRVALENHVELAHLIALHAVRAVGLKMPGPVHVAVHPADHLARAFQISEPVRRVRRAQLRGVFVDEGLEDTVDVRADCRPVGCPIVIRRKESGRQQRHDRDPCQTFEHC